MASAREGGRESGQSSLNPEHMQPK